jgi:hypothetical protein
MAAAPKETQNPNSSTSDSKNMATVMEDKQDVEAFENEEKKDVFDRVTEEDISLEQRQMEMRIL